MKEKSVFVLGKRIGIKDDSMEAKYFEFEWPIEEVVRSQEMLVVLLDVEPGASFNENVFGMDLNGNIRWQIQKRKYMYEDSPYTGVISIGNKVKLYNWDGTDITVDPITGEILSVEEGK